MRFFVGLHHPNDAKLFNSCFISVNTLRRRQSCFKPMRYWVMDSGAFSTISRYGGYPEGPDEYACEIFRWRDCGVLLAAVTQDYMCEPVMLKKTGLTVIEHQVMTVERYDILKEIVDRPYILPVLQGYDPSEYLDHIEIYGDRLIGGMWVGVGSVCKRNGNPKAVAEVLKAILTVRPDLRLHGFGLKTTALRDPEVRNRLWSADSMSWSFRARKEGRNPNDPMEAESFRLSIG